MLTLDYQCLLGNPLSGDPCRSNRLSLQASSPSHIFQSLSFEKVGRVPKNDKRLEMSDQPPPYDNSKRDSKTGSGNVKQWNFADEVTISRSQHVAAAASKVRELLESRARYGIAGATLLLIPGRQIGT